MARGWILALAVAAAGRLPAADVLPAVIRIVLPPSVEVSDPLVTVGHVAHLEGGDPLLRQRAAGLDLMHFGESPDNSSVSSRQVTIRLLLAGFPPAAFVVMGAEQVRVVMKQATLPDEDVEQSIRAALANTFQLDDQDVEVRLLQPVLPKPDLAGIDPEHIVLKPVLPAELPLGRARIQVVLYYGQDRLQECDATVEVAHYRTAASAAKLILRGEVLSEDHVVEQRVRLVSPASLVTAADVVGREATRVLQAGERLRAYDVATADLRTEPLPWLVKAREKARVVARSGGLTVVLSAAEALQSGRMGDAIRVRNPNSNKVITARVVGRGELEVLF